MIMALIWTMLLVRKEVERGRNGECCIEGEN